MMYNHARLVLLAMLFSLAIGPTSLLAADEASDRGPITPTSGVLKLFNGQNLDGLYTYFRDTKLEDPRHVVTVHDGLLHISGDGVGGVSTRREYRDYHMICEFRWGPRTWGARTNRTKDSGALVHCQGPEGGYAGIWMESIEAQIIQGGTGDFIVVRGTGQVQPRLTAEVTKDRDGENVWCSGGQKQVFTSGRVNWFGRDPDWADVLGFRGKNDVESPADQWTRMDVICRGDRITILVNGVKVNEAFDVYPAAGKLTLQSEMAEIFFRRWELWPLDKAPAASKQLDSK
jgi:hypothetical protein